MKKGWETKKLSDICDIATGKWDANHATENGAYRFYTCAKDYLYSDTKRFSGECLVLPGNGVNVGDVYYYNGDFDAYQRTYVISNIRASAKYVYYHLLLNWRERNSKKQYGSATNFIKIGNFTDYELPIPPLPEQQRIVALLDETFAALTKVHLNAERNQVNAREVFEAELERLFSNGKDWKEKIFANLIDSNVIGLTKNTRKQGIDKKYKYVKMNNITPSNDFDFSKFTCVDATKDEVEKYSLEDGDFLFNTRNSKELVGKTCVYREVDKDPVLYNNNIMRVRFHKEINSRFVNYQFSTETVRKKLESMKSGTTNVFAIYYNNLQNLPLLIPPLAEQRAIVGRLDALGQETRRLEEVYQSKVEAVEELRKSVLQKAFSGEL